MARTTILPTDPNKRKAWAAAVAEDAAKTQYFARMQRPEGSRSAIVKKTDLEKGAADEVTTALVAKLRGHGTPARRGISVGCPVRAELIQSDCYFANSF